MDHSNHLIQQNFRFHVFILSKNNYVFIDGFPVISCNKQGNDKADREAKTALYQTISNIKTGSIHRH